MTVYIASVFSVDREGIMKNTLPVALVLTSIVGITTVAAANPFSDVNADSWAYQSVEELAQEGIITGYPDGTFKGQASITRYEMAQMVAKAMANQDKANAEQQAMINRLADEFGQELVNLGVRVSNLEDRVGNIKMTGDMRLRYLGSDHSSNSAGYAYALGKQSFFDMRARLKMTAKVNDSTTAGVRFKTSGEFGNSNTSNNVTVDQAYVTHQFSDKVHLTLGRYEQIVGNGLSYWDSFDGARLHVGTPKFNVEGAYGYMVTDGFSKLSTKQNISLGLINVKGKLGKHVDLGSFYAHASAGEIRRYPDPAGQPSIRFDGDDFYGFSVDYTNGGLWLGGEWLRGKDTDKTTTWTAGASYGNFTFAQQKKGTWLGKLQYISEERYSPVITSAFAFAYDLSTPRMNRDDLKGNGYKGWMLTGRYALADNTVLSAFYGFDSKDQSGHNLPDYYRAEINVRF